MIINHELPGEHQCRGVDEGVLEDHAAATLRLVQGPQDVCNRLSVDTHDVPPDCLAGRADLPGDEMIVVARSTYDTIMAARPALRRTDVG